MYYRRKEDDMEKKLVSKGWKLIEDTARRRKFCADRVMERNDITFVVDHKSTRGTSEINFKRDWYSKVKDEGKKYDETAIPLITMSFRNSSKLYLVIELDEFNKLIEKLTEGDKK